MYQRDYIMRMISQITQMIAAQILKLKQLEKYTDALAALGELYKRLGLPSAELVRRMSARQTADMLTVNGALQTHKAVAVAELLREEAAIYELQGDRDEREEALIKALQLHLIAFREYTVPEPGEHIDSLLKLVPPQLLSDEDGVLLLDYYERTGRFGRAMEALREMIEQSDGTVLHEAGIRLCERFLSAEHRGEPTTAVSAARPERNEVELYLKQLKEEAGFA